MNPTPRARAEPEASAFVSRGGVKLAGALEDFRIDVTGRRALDAGASTGGFSDCLLQHGAASVIAVDVAYGQLAWKLRIDDRVRVVERANVRSLDLEALGEPPVDLVVADLSFISLAKVRDALLASATDDADFLLMVKPQFEAPRALVPRGGVVRDEDTQRDSMRAVADAYRAAGCGLVAATASPLTGPKGNREFFLHLRRGAPDAGDAPIDAAVTPKP